MFEKYIVKTKKKKVGTKTLNDHLNNIIILLIEKSEK